MPTITLNRKEFEKYLGKKLPVEKLKDRISYLGTDLEEVTDDEIHVEIFPNRPDLLSMQGFSRALNSFIGHKPGLAKYDVKDSGEKLIIDPSVKKVRPYTSCAIVKNIAFTDEGIKEVIDIQEKLHVTYGRNRKKVAIGIYPMQHIAFPILFTAEKPEDIVFQPLEFDKEMNALEILEQHPAGQTYGHLLEGKKIFPVFRDANNEVLSVPPIINSHKTGKVDENTTEAFIECSGFDYDALSKALNMIVTAFADMGADIYSMKIEDGKDSCISPILEPTSMKFDLEYTNRLLGLDLTEKQAISLLEKMGYGYDNGKALIPSYRADILHQTDLVEDISIAYGFENFDAMIPQVATVAQEDEFEKFKLKIVELLVGLGFLETSTYHLTSEEVQTKKMNVKSKSIVLENSISLDYNVIRHWLLPLNIEVLANNKHYEYPQKIFSVGGVFKKNKKTETGVEEPHILSVVVASEKVDYTQIRQILDYIFRSIDVEHSVKEGSHDSFVPGRVAEAVVKNKKIGFFGEISPIVLENWELEMPVAALELNLTELFDLMNKN